MNHSALTKPRFSLLHVTVFALALIVSTAVFRNWSDFKDGFRDGYNFGAGTSEKK